MRVAEFPDSLRKQLQDKILSLECSIQQVSVLLDVQRSCISAWLNGNTRSITQFNKLKVSLFSSGYLDSFIGWLLQEADAHPLQIKELAHALYQLYQIQHGLARPAGRKRLSPFISELGQLFKSELQVIKPQNESIQNPQQATEYSPKISIFP